MYSIALKRLLSYCLAGLCLSSANVTLAQTLAQEPLLSKTISVRPNLSFILDDSGSMGWRCIYKANVQATIIAQGSTAGVGSDCLANTDLRQTSPDTNILAYDPRKYYPTGISETGTAIADSAETWINMRTARPTINGTRTSVYVVYLAGPNFNVNTATQAQLTNSANYTALVLTSNTANGFGTYNSVNDTYALTNTNPFPASTARIDCGGTTCTYNQELQNLRNWHTYHRDRIGAAKVGVSIAFTGLPDSFRMNYTTLGEAIRSKVNGTASLVPLLPVNNYANNINAFRRWLNNESLANGVATPLPRVLDIVGKNYDNNTANNGPWGNTPWAAGNEAATDHLSCRRSFMVMTTDGFWNAGSDLAQTYTPTVVGDSDGTNGALISHLKPAITYQYQAGNTSDPRNKGKADRISGSGESNTLADYAHYYWAKDLRPDLVNNVSIGTPDKPAFWQSLSTYTVGFGVDGRLNAAQIAAAKAGTANWGTPVANDPSAVDDMIHAAHNSGGEFIAVGDATDFSIKLRGILLSIAGESSSQAGVAASTTALQAGTKKYVPYYTTGEWWGNLSAVSLNPTTGADIAPPAWQVTSVDGNGRPTGASTIPAAATRGVYVYTNSTTMAVTFTYANITNASYALQGSTTDKLTTTFNANMTDYIRGDRTNEGSGRLYRERTALLGDIVNSRPAFVKNTTDPLSAYANLPSTSGGSTTYVTYKNTKAARTEGVLFVGANDGMLHGFAESNGAEKYAFIPRSVLGNLHRLTDKNYPLNHRFFVDGPLKETDAFIQSRAANGSYNAAAWTGVLTGTTGAGAKAVFALNVSDPLNMSGHHALWEVNNLSTGFSELGHVLADVDTGVTPSGDWVAVFGNGYDSASGKASLFLVNLSTGAKIRELTAGTQGNNGLGGVRLVRNSKAQIVGAYAGDLLGNVWRFDLSAASSASWLDGQLLFTAKSTAASATQTITATPGVVTRTDGRDGYIVVVGTGRLLTDTDADASNSTYINSVYGLWDKATFGGTATFSAITSKSSLVPNTTAQSVTADGTDFYNVGSTRAIDWAGTDRGWYLDYTILSGQRSVYPIETLKTLVRVDTIAPRSTIGTCSIDGVTKAINYLLDPYNGACRTRATIDINNDGAVDGADGLSCAYAGQGDGTNTVLNSGASTADAADLRFIIGATDKKLIKDDDPPPPGPPAGCDASTDPNQCRIRRDVRQIFIRP